MVAADPAAAMVVVRTINIPLALEVLGHALCRALTPTPDVTALAAALVAGGAMLAIGAGAVLGQADAGN